MATMDRIFSGYESRLAVLQAVQNPFAKGVAWVAGELTPLHKARIPLMDQGFLHSDLTYDVPAVWDGRFFRLDDHIDRLSLSCQKIRLKLPLPKEEVKNILIDMVAKSGIRDAFVEIIVTRGLKGVRGAEGEMKNLLYMFVMPYVWVMPPEVQKVGGSAVVAKTVRRIPEGSMDPTVKNLQWGDFTKAMYEAKDRDAMHPFLTTSSPPYLLTEGSGFNIFLLHSSILYTPSRGCLLGITRKTVLEIAASLGLETRVQDVPVEMLYEAEEVFMCTTAGGIMPIAELDGKRVGSGEVGLWTRRVWDAYWECHCKEEFTIKICYDEL